MHSFFNPWKNQKIVKIHVFREKRKGPLRTIGLILSLIGSLIDPPMCPFYIPWKHQKFLGGIKWENWPEMGDYIDICHYSQTYHNKSKDAKAAWVPDMKKQDFLLFVCLFLFTCLCSICLFV